MKAVLRREFVAIKTLKNKKSQINGLTVELKELEKKRQKEQSKLKASRRIEIINTGAELNKIGKRKNNQENQIKQKFGF